MTTLTLPTLTARGIALDVAPDCFGTLRSSADLWDDASALRERMQRDGYLFLPDCLDRDDILEARRTITSRLAKEGLLDLSSPEIDAVALPGLNMAFRPDLALNNPPLEKAVYSGPIMDFFARFLQDEVLHYDFTWLRAAAPGKNSSPHCDVVYMGRGTFDVFTAWTPLGDIGVGGGQLMLLEGSHLRSQEIQDYLSRDVDTFCVNTSAPGTVGESIAQGTWDGILDHDVVRLQRRLGGRWLTSEFRMGDILIFTLGTVHASLDNHSPYVRLSTDTRYQRASEPADERWIGENPIGHSQAAKRGRIC